MPSTWKKTWVAKDDAVEKLNVSTDTVPAKPAKGRQKRATDVPRDGKGSGIGRTSTSNAKFSNRSRGTRTSTTTAEKTLAARSMSVDEVQHGLTMLIHQFKSASQDETYAMPMQYPWQEHIDWSVESMHQQMSWEDLQCWGEVQHPWNVLQPQHGGSSLLHSLPSASETVPLSVIESDEGTSFSEKTYGRGYLLRSRRCLLSKPGGVAYDGPNWNVGRRPLELIVQVNTDEVSVPAMPRSPPPVAPPAFHVDAPSFEPAPNHDAHTFNDLNLRLQDHLAREAWNASTQDPSMSLDGRYLTPEMSMAGYMSGFGCSEDMGWQAHAESYYPSGCDANGMPLLLPEVPAWPFAFSEQSMSSYGSTALAANGYMSHSGKLDGQDAEDIESTAASSGRPPSVSQSPVHTPTTMDAVAEATARLQVEYYLSIDNLCRDPYLCSKLDKDGWVALEVLATFPRMQRLGIDAAAIAAALAGSAQLEVSQELPLRVRGRRQEERSLALAAPTTE